MEPGDNWMMASSLPDRCGPLLGLNLIIRGAKNQKFFRQPEDWTIDIKKKKGSFCLQMDSRASKCPQNHIFFRNNSGLISHQFICIFGLYEKWVKYVHFCKNTNIISFTLPPKSLITRKCSRRIQILCARD